MKRRIFGIAAMLLMSISSMLSIIATPAPALAAPNDGIISDQSEGYLCENHRTIPCVELKVTLTKPGVGAPPTVRITRHKAIGHDDLFDMSYVDATHFDSGPAGITDTYAGSPWCTSPPPEQAIFDITVTGTATGTLKGINLCSNFSPKANNGIKAVTVTTTNSSTPATTGGIKGTIMVTNSAGKDVPCDASSTFDITGPTDKHVHPDSKGSFNTGLTLKPGTYDVHANCPVDQGHTDVYFTGVVVKAGEITDLKSTTCKIGDTCGDKGTGDNTEDTSLKCSAGPGFTWLICGVIKLAVAGVDWTRENIIVPFLKETPLDTKNAAYPVWEAFRNVANVFLILIFFLVIFGTAIGFDNYTVKKTLPRLVAATLFIQISWAISGFIIDIGNVLGQGIVALVNSMYEPAGKIPVPKIDFTSGGFSSTAILFTGGALVGVGAATGVIGLTLSSILSLAIALLAVFFTLAFRRVLILLLAVLSGLAFLLWVLPNTEKFFKEWLSTLIKLSLMYPLIMLCFMGGRIFASVANGTYGSSGAAADTAIPLFQLAGYIVPLLAIPFTFQFAGRTMTAGSKGISKVASGLDNKWGKNSDFAKDRAEVRRANNAIRATDPNNKFGRVGRAIARQRGGFNSAFPGLPQSDAQKNRMYAARDKAIAEKASAATAEKFNTKSSKELLDLKTQAAQDRMMDVRIDEAAISVKLADGSAIRDAALTGDTTDASGNTVKGNVSQLRDIISNSQTDDATRIAAMRALGKSQGGQQVLQGLRESQFGGTTTDLVAPQHADTWAKGTRDIKTDDFRKPPVAAYKDTSSEEVAGMSSLRIGRQMDYYKSELDRENGILNTQTKGTAEYKATEARIANITKVGQEFSSAVQGALESKTLRGKVQPNTVQAIQEHLGESYFSDGARQQVNSRAAEIAPPAAQVVPQAVSRQVMQAAAAANGGTADVGHLAAIHNELASNTTLRNTLEQQILNNQPITVNNLPANLQAPTPATSSTMPAAVQAQILSDHKDNLNNIAAINAAYNDSNRTDYQPIVHQAVTNNKTIPLPPPPPK